MQSVQQCLVSLSQTTVTLSSGVLQSLKATRYSSLRQLVSRITSDLRRTVEAQWIADSMQETFEELARLSSCGTKPVVASSKVSPTDAERSITYA
jgi:hypothetical protein